MSKVYSFRLNDENPRETQAKEVIQAWTGEGYSLRYVVVEALLSFENKDVGHTELSVVVEQLQDLFITLNRPLTPKSSNAGLSNSFLDAVKQSAKDGMKVE